MGTMTWESLPAGVRDVIAGQAGQIVKAEPLEKGPAPGVAAVLHGTDGERYVLKAAPEDSPAAALYVHEMDAGAGMPLTLPAPRMRYSAVTGGWILLLFDYLPGTTADLSPSSPHLPGVLAGLRAIGATEAWAGLPPVARHVRRLQSAAARLTAILPPGELPDLYAAALTGFDPRSLEGGQLAHYDVHRGNILMSRGQALWVDWAFACAAAEGLDAIMLLPRLAAAGHQAGDALEVIAELPGWQDLPVAGVVALWTMFRHCKALTGPTQDRGKYVPSVSAGQTMLRQLMS